MFMRITIKFLVVATACFMGVAHANEILEAEFNHPIIKAQLVPFSEAATVKAELAPSGLFDGDDVDFYKFSAQKGQAYSFDIDNGTGGQSTVDTTLVIFSPEPDYNIVDTSTQNEASEPDPGSVNNLDPFIESWVAPETGQYIIGVIDDKRDFSPGGSYPPPDGGFLSSPGDYDLVISKAKVEPTVMKVAIMVRPGKNQISDKPINPKSRGKIPVAILGGGDFSPLNIDLDTLTFGSTGSEKSLVNCNMNGVDLNHDGIVDLICHFDNQAAQFKITDEHAKLRGTTANGVAFEGTGYLKVRPARRMP